MEKRINLDKVTRNYRMKKLGKGHNGTCYLTSDGRVYKQYHTQGIDDDITAMLLELQYEGFTFPEQLVIVDGILKGYLKKYEEGQTLDKLNYSKVKLVDFLKALRRFENQLRDFSYETNLDVYDLNLHNLIYTPDKRIVDIDTDPIAPFTYPVGNPHYENSKYLAESLNKIFMEGEFQSARLQQLQRECLVGGFIRPSTFISEAAEQMDKMATIDTIQDYNEGLVLLRK